MTTMTRLALAITILPALMAGPIACTRQPCAVEVHETLPSEGESRFIWTQYPGAESDTWVRHGLELCIGVDGRVEEITTWKDGVRDGWYCSYQDGAVRESGRYANGKRVGPWKFRMPDGSLREETQPVGAEASKPLK